MFALGFTALIAALSGQQDAKVEPVTIDNYVVMQMTKESCQAITSQGEDGNIFLSFGESDANKGHFVLIDRNWSGLENNQSVAGSLSWDGGKTNTAVTFRAGKLSSGSFMLDLITAPGFSQSMIKAGRVTVRIPSLNWDQTLELPNIATVVNGIHACNAKL